MEKITLNFEMDYLLPLDVLVVDYVDLGHMYLLLLEEKHLFSTKLMDLTVVVAHSMDAECHTQR